MLAISCMTKYSECFLQLLHFPPTGYISRNCAANMKSLLVFIAVIAVTLAWRNYAQYEHFWPMPLPSEPHHHPPKFDFNMEATVQLGKNIFKSGQKYFILGGNDKFLCCLGKKCSVKASGNLPKKSCCFIASNIGNGIVAFKSCREEKYMQLVKDRIRPTSDVINQTAQFTVVVSSPGKWTGAQYVYLKACNDMYWGVNKTESIVNVTYATTVSATKMTVMEVY